MCLCSWVYSLHFIVHIENVVAQLMFTNKFNVVSSFRNWKNDGMASVFFPLCNFKKELT